MRDEIRDIYFLMLGMEDISEFQGGYNSWPRDHTEYWYKGNIIDYHRVLEFLDEVYKNREQNNTTG